MSLALFQVFVGIQYFLRILELLLFVYMILRLFRPQFQLYFLLERFLEPLLRPFRMLNLKLMSRMRSGFMLDFSIWFAFIALEIVKQLAWVLYGFLARL